MTWASVGCGVVAALGTCSCQRTVEISDLHADFRELWQGYEKPETGKEVRPDAKVTIEFSAKPKAHLSVGSYYPTEKVARFAERGGSMPERCDDEVPAVRSTTEPSEDGSSNAFTIGATRPNAITLAASRPLIKGCLYEFRISSDVPITDDGARLNQPLAVRFRVGSARLFNELANVRIQRQGFSHFSARAGVNTPVAEALVRYHSFLGIPAADLKPDTPQTAARTFYHQYAHGYRVDDEGYFITSDAGMFREAAGEVIPDVPASAGPRLDSAAALRIALAYLKAAEPPWSHPPAGDLYLRAMKSSSRPAVVRLVWGFHAATGSGVVGLEFMSVDATSGAVFDVPGSPVVF